MFATDNTTLSPMCYRWGRSTYTRPLVCLAGLWSRTFPAGGWRERVSRGDVFLIPSDDSDAAILSTAFAGIPGVVGFGWEGGEHAPLVWVIADVPRDDVKTAVYDAEDALTLDHERRHWEFLLVAADDPDMTDAWEGQYPPNFQAVPSHGGRPYYGPSGWCTSRHWGGGVMGGSTPTSPSTARRRR